MFKHYCNISGTVMLFIALITACFLPIILYRMKSHVMKYRDVVEGYVVDVLTWTAGVPQEKVADFV